MGFSLKKIVSSVSKVIPGFSPSPTNLLNETKWGSAASAVATGNPYAAVVQGAVGLGQDLLSGWWNTKQQEKLNDNAFAQNVSLWNMQNAYNDPVSQMQRLERANLNKNLVYGGGNVTGNTTSNYPTYEPVKYSGVGQFLNRNQQKQIAMAQLDLGMKEFQQRVTNQSINNGIALEKLELYKKINQALLKQYGETIRGKKLMNDFFENPFSDVNAKNSAELINLLAKLWSAR